MLIFKKTSMLAVRHVLVPEVMGTVAEAVVKDTAGALGHIAAETATAIAGDWVRTVAGKVRSHFTDHSAKLAEALAKSNERAWKTIEIALGGRRFWDRFAAAEDRALRDQVKAFLESTVAGDDPDFLTACLRELRQARDKGHLAAGDGFRPEALADEVGPFARFDDPEALLSAECEVVEEVAGEFRRLGYRHLGRLLAVTPTRGQPLLAMAAQYYFRRAVGEDPVLARELNWVRLTAVDRRVEEGFALLALIQERHGQQLEEALEGLARVEVVVVETHDVVLEIHAKVNELANKYKLGHRELTAGDSVSIRDEHERALIVEVKRWYRALPEDQRRRFPQLGLDVARLEYVAGAFPAAWATAREAAGQLSDSGAKAAAHHAAYRAALELGAWDEALAELLAAVEADTRYALWPRPKYQVERILGAGGFGVALLCRDIYLDRQVVIKSFEAAGIDRDAAAIFREARLLESLNHAGIIHLYGCGYVDPNREQRPYLELAHFAGSLSLDHHVRQHGPLTPDDLLPVAVQTAEALEAAHEAGVLHRDLKPGNLLVRKTARGWEVKVIDFGLSLRRSLVRTSQARGVSLGRTMVGSAVAGTLHYAAPEQLDPDRSREVGTHSDVYGLGRTCLFALFRSTLPRARAIRALPEPWPDLLDDCCDPEIASRPKDLAAVLSRLRDIPDSKATTPPPSSSPTSPTFGKAPAPPAQPAEAAAPTAAAEASPIAKLAAAEPHAVQQPPPVAEIAAVESQAAREPALAVPAAEVPTPEKLGRPLTLKEKLAAARAGRTTATGAAAGTEAAAKPAAGPRSLPPLERIIDPHDPAEALHLAGASKTKEVTAKTRSEQRTAPSPRFTNSLGMTMVRIEPGEFLMGSTKAQIDTLMMLFPDVGYESVRVEQPQHAVKITRPFYLAAHPVTVGQFRRFVEESGYQTEAEQSAAGSYDWDGEEWTLDPRKNWRSPGFTQEDDHPVVCVSHNDAMAFLGWLNGQKEEQERGYRLPTEAEWEYACRAGTRGLFGADDNPETLVRTANVDYASRKTTPVGSFAPNAWQLYDMIGNIWEWCDDWFDEEFYQSSPKENPHNTAQASGRVIRGGGWDYLPRDCRPALRSRDAPALRNGSLGFRLAAVQQSATLAAPTPTRVATPTRRAKVARDAPASSWKGSKAGEVKVVRVKDQEMRFRWCPPTPRNQPFRMGSPTPEKGRRGNEDQVEVTLTRGFWMQETEVTQGLWQAVIGTTLDWSFGSGPNLPVYNVNHGEAVGFGAKLTELLRQAKQLPSGWTIGLPTEAQWEYATRAGTTSRFPFGEDENQLGEHAWYSSNSGGKPHEVKTRAPSPWGLHDMLGNVWEWCADGYADKLLGGVDPLGLSRASTRVYRGGSWHSLPGYCRPAIRYANAPAFRYDYIGFRVAAVQQ
jgi:formylglycine-generating enzyme required for sulfatase activity/serine/threonine protein kinase